MEEHVKARLMGSAHGFVGGVSAVVGAGMAGGTACALLAFGVLVFLDGLDWMAVSRHREMLEQMRRDVRRQDGA